MWTDDTYPSTFGRSYSRGQRSLYLAEGKENNHKGVTLGGFHRPLSTPYPSMHVPLAHTEPLSYIQWRERLRDSCAPRGNTGEMGLMNDWFITRAEPLKVSPTCLPYSSPRFLDYRYMASPPVQHKHRFLSRKFCWQVPWLTMSALGCTFLCLVSFFRPSSCSFFMYKMTVVFVSLGR